MTDQDQEGDGKKSREGTTSITITFEIALYTLQGSQASSHKRQVVVVDLAKISIVLKLFILVLFIFLLD